MSASIALENDRMKGIIKKVSSRVLSMKTRQQLQVSISKLNREISYVQDKLTVTTGENTKISQQLDSLKNTLRAPQRQLNELMFEKETVLKSFSSQSKLEQEIQVKSKKLSDLKIKIDQVEEEVRYLSITEKEYMSQNYLLVQENRQHNQEISNIHQQTTHLTSEIQSKKRIFELLGEILGKHSDENINTQAVVQKYLDDTRAETSNLSTTIDQALTKINDIQKELPDVTSEKNRLEEKVNEALAHVGENYDIDQLKKTLQINKEKETSLLQKNENKLKEIRQLEAEIDAVEKQINNEKETESRSTRRYEYLLSQQKKMDKIDDPEKEIERLQQSINDFQQDISISKSILDVSGDVRKELSDMQDIIKTNMSFYDGELASMRDALAKLLLEDI